MGRTYIGGDKKIKAYLGNKSIYRIYYGSERIYPNAGTVTYYVDTNTVYTEEVDIDDSCLSPKTFTPTKSGWTFRGWRENKTASSSVLSSKVMTGENVTLYAVFQQTITVTYYANGGTSTPTAQTKYKYYNNGNTTANPTFTLSAAISKSNAKFRAWGLGSASSATMYAAGSTQTFSSSVSLYAKWYTLTTKSGSFTAYIYNWVGTLKIVPYGCIFSESPTVSFYADNSEYDSDSSVITKNNGFFVLDCENSGSSGGSTTMHWTAKGYAYDDNAPYAVATGSSSWTISNWSGGSVNVSFGRTFKSVPSVVAVSVTTNGGGRPTFTVSNITTTGCTINWASNQMSGGNGTINWAAYGAI